MPVSGSIRVYEESRWFCFPTLAARHAKLRPHRFQILADCLPACTFSATGRKCLRRRLSRQTSVPHRGCCLMTKPTRRSFLPQRILWWPACSATATVVLPAASTPICAICPRIFPADDSGLWQRHQRTGTCGGNRSTSFAVRNAPPRTPIPC